MQYGPILAALNTTIANQRIRIFHTRVKLRYKTTQDVASYSILTIQLLVVCFTVLVWWPKTVTAKALTSGQKEKPHGKTKKTHGKKKTTRGKKKNLTAKRKRLKAKRKPHGKKKRTHGKISSIPRGQFNSYFFCREVVVILFAVRLFFMP